MEAVAASIICCLIALWGFGLGVLSIIDQPSRVRPLSTFTTNHPAYCECDPCVIEKRDAIDELKRQMEIDEEIEEARGAHGGKD